MKPLELTPEQKDNLLEMCNHLYKGKTLKNNLVTEVVLSDQQGRVGYHAVADERVYIYIATIMGFPITIIHWFEFCMTHLSHAIIFNPNNSLRACNHNHAGLLESTMSLFYNEDHAIHPVDYLYEQFLKLK